MRQVEDKQNQELLDLSQQILDLTKAVHNAVERSNETVPASGGK